ncbi:helix-turn-helix transcriptional regulator, partial [Escherichia coli]|nr:helix-turn-helix transcriptional regulator [Escherichia coli]
MDKRAKNQIVDSDIARLLLKLRKSRNLTVTELAQRSGVSQAMISKVERGTTDAGAGFEQTLTGMTVGIDS